MDLLSVVGLTVGFGAILLGQHLAGGHLSSLMNGPAILIVMGGTVGAVMLQSPLGTFVRAMHMTIWVFKPPEQRAAEAIERIVQWSQVARKEGLLGLETVAEEETDPFAQKGLQLLVDGSEPDTIRATHDVLQMPVIIGEAGGRFTDLAATESATGGSGLATNGVLHDDLLALLAPR